LACVTFSKHTHVVSSGRNGIVCLNSPHAYAWKMSHRPMRSLTNNSKIVTPTWDEEFPFNFDTQSFWGLLQQQYNTIMNGPIFYRIRRVWIWSFRKCESSTNINLLICVFFWVVREKNCWRLQIFSVSRLFFRFLRQHAFCAPFKSCCKTKSGKVRLINSYTDPLVWTHQTNCNVAGIQQLNQ
jgi:hypothetical protein